MSRMFLARIFHIIDFNEGVIDVSLDDDSSVMGIQTLDPPHRGQSSSDPEEFCQTLCEATLTHIRGIRV